MRRWKSSFLAVLVGALSFAQVDSPLKDPRAYQTAEKLKCLCGCPMTVANCTMIKCHYADPARHQVAEAVATGKSEDVILASFTKKEGLRALAVPPQTGFNSLTFLMVPIFVLLGLGLIAWFVRRNRAVPATGPADDPVNPTLDRYHDQIERDLAKME